MEVNLQIKALKLFRLLKWFILSTSSVARTVYCFAEVSFQTWIKYYVHLPDQLTLIYL